VHKSKNLRVIGLAAVGYFIVCGGPYGTEPIVAAVGPGWAVLLLLMTPVFFSLPFALVVAELSSLMPAEGGYYVWIRDTLGPFWGVQMGWINLFTALLLLAIFPVLFSGYLAQLAQIAFPGALMWLEGSLAHWLLAFSVIVTTITINLRGAQSVGRWAEASFVLVIGGFSTFVVLALMRHGATATLIDAIGRDLHGAQPAHLVLGLSLILFNFGGWDSLSTIAGEVDDAPRNYPRVLAVLLILVVMSYLLPVLAGIATTPDPERWKEGAGWPILASLAGGRPLGALIAFGGVVANWALFNSQMLSASRLPLVMSRDGWLPPGLARSNERTGVPSVSILVCGVIAAGLAALSYGNLIVILALFNMLGLALELAALIILRLRRPDAQRPFRIPGGRAGLLFVTAAPLTVLTITLATMLRAGHEYAWQLSVNVIAIAMGVALYLVGRARKQSASQRAPASALMSPGGTHPPDGGAASE